MPVSSDLPANQLDWHWHHLLRPRLDGLTVDAWTVRWVFHHLINELARHAGHADIVRESIDGATMYELIAGFEGAEPTPWLIPWQPGAKA